jgi:hypothetical protein
MSWLIRLRMAMEEAVTRSRLVAGTDRPATSSWLTTERTIK